jgi:hypothetical protein
MSTEPVSSRDASDRRKGRPKGVPTQKVQKMVEAWDRLKQTNPKASNAALLNMVAEAVFGVRLNPVVRKRDTERLRRTLRRHGKI